MSDDSQSRTKKLAEFAEALGPQVYQSLTNEEYIKVYQTVSGLEKKLSHPEFHFVRYMLRMILQEFEEQNTVVERDELENSNDNSNASEPKKVGEL